MELQPASSSYLQKHWFDNLDDLLKDVVYGTIFSVVLLNTDLNTVNIGPRASKKMSLKVFLKNTLALADNMTGKPTASYESLREGSKEMESILKVAIIY